jgi:hypothetical protein
MSSKRQASRSLSSKPDLPEQTPHAREPRKFPLMLGADEVVRYHVEVHGHFYSVPHRLMREVIETRITDQTIEQFHQGNRVACHVEIPGSTGTPRSPSTCLALQLQISCVSESMGNHDSGDRGWLEHRLRQRWIYGRPAFVM